MFPGCMGNLLERAQPAWRTPMITCRECEAEINQATEVCPHCGADLTQTDPAEPAKKKPTLGKILMRWGILLGVLLGALWSFLWFIAPPRTGNLAVDAEAHAVQALGDVHAALVSYAQAQNGVYPPSLEPLGDPARQAAQMAQSDGYQLQYTPGPSGPDGQIHTYELQARAGNSGYRNFYSDNTGVIRATREQRDANSLDPPVQ